jgi:hypothetical protein
MLQLLLPWWGGWSWISASRFSEDLMCSVDLSREHSMFHFLIALPLLSASPFTSFLHFLLAFWFSLLFFPPVLPSSKSFVKMFFLAEISIKFN